MNTRQHFIQPLDILFLRGNKLFGDSGSYGESHIPPWPSVAAGALRSAFLAYRGIDPNQFAKGQLTVSELGTPLEPGPFALTAFHLAKYDKAANGRGVEPLFQLPADLLIKQLDGDTHSESELRLDTLRPNRVTSGIYCSKATRLLPVLPENERGKPEHGFWLTIEGWKKYLAGQIVNPKTHLVRNSLLWRMEMRVGVGLDYKSKRASDGALFSNQGIVMRQYEHFDEDNTRFGVGFLAETVGAEFPESFPLRLGGDGRAAIARCVQFRFPQPDYQAISRNRRCRLVLTSPGIFAEGWLPTGTVRSGTDLQFNLHGVRATLTCAAVPRAETVSGFDIARGMPKPAHRAVPCGSVYWLEDLEATPDALESLVRMGLWSDHEELPTRRAEGFNRFALASQSTE